MAGIVEAQQEIIRLAGIGDPTPIRVIEATQALSLILEAQDKGENVPSPCAFAAAVFTHGLAEVAQVGHAVNTEVTYFTSLSNAYMLDATAVPSAIDIHPENLAQVDMLIKNGQDPIFNQNKAWICVAPPEGSDQKGHVFGIRRLGKSGMYAVCDTADKSSLVTVESLEEILDRTKGYIEDVCEGVEGNPAVGYIGFRTD